LEELVELREEAALTGMYGIKGMGTSQHESHEQHEMGVPKAFHFPTSIS
jgi:hypothetical protein